MGRRAAPCPRSFIGSPEKPPRFGARAAGGFRLSERSLEAPRFRLGSTGSRSE
jgi:hypothetical protein